jgi:hypothetical protein
MKSLALHRCPDCAVWHERHPSGLMATWSDTHHHRRRRAHRLLRRAWLAVHAR